MTSLIAIPFLIGSVPIGLAVVGAYHFLKDKEKTNKFLYWGGITASAFGGWVVSNMLMNRYVEAYGAEFAQPYRGRGGLDFGRDSKGRFRRQLVTPIEDKEYEHGMLTKEKTLFPPPKRFFYRWVGQLPHHANPIMYGNPDAFELGGNGLNDAVLIHYVSPLYDEEYVKTLVHNLNKISNK